MTARPTKGERETLIRFDETSAPATIFTYDKAWQQHLEKRLGLKPTMNNGCGGREYQLDKIRIRPPRAPRQLSPEQRKTAAERLTRGRHQNPPNRCKKPLSRIESRG